MKKKVAWKPGNMLYPVPAVMVSLADKEGRPNIITLAWAGTVCSSPPMLSVSIRPERYSYDLIKETGEFVVNLTTEALAFATDYCGVKSGRETDKFKELNLTPEPAAHLKAPAIAESPVHIECKLREIIKLGSHDLFLAEVVGVGVDASLLDENNALQLAKANLIAYSHGRYFALGEELGRFGFSVRKKEAGLSSNKAKKQGKALNRNKLPQSQTAGTKRKQGRSEGRVSKTERKGR